MHYKPDLDRFEEEVIDHTLDIQKDDGLFRHIVCSNKGSSCYKFNITTWPGYLCISGDMGCYVFSREIDMFGFFVSGKRDENYINPGYWGEKLQERGENYKKYCPQKFEKQIRETLDYYLQDEEDEQKRDDLEDKLDVFFTETDIDFELDARRDIQDFPCDAFIDAWECDFTEYTHHYIWCLRAIVWCIERYNEQKEAAVA